jgi:hypothetical protein
MITYAHTERRGASAPNDHVEDCDALGGAHGVGLARVEAHHRQDLSAPVPLGDGPEEEDVPRVHLGGRQDERKEESAHVRRRASQRCQQYRVSS